MRPVLAHIAHGKDVALGQLVIERDIPLLRFRGPDFRVPDAERGAGIGILLNQRGQALVQQGDMAGALSEFNKALEINKNSSLAHYRVAEVFFLQHNYQASANAYRDCLNGDGDPRWTEGWSHIQLGKIFDITGQRERATNEYRQALQTNDNTQGAQEEARRYLQKPFEQQKNSQQDQKVLIRPAQ